jgi:radical SAM protein with 4Fe4S-binding SPASM domain
MIHMIKKKIIPYATVAELTLQCNMHCIHCGSSAGTHRSNELTTTEWKQVITDLAQLGGKQITLMGGEPFLRSDWYELAQTVKKNHMDTIFMTNGYLINDDIIAKLKTLQPYAIAISIDGGCAETHDAIRGLHGSFNKCIKVLTQLQKAHLPSTVITTVHKKNYKELPQLRNLLINRNIAWQIQMADPIGRFPKELHLSPKEFYSVALFIAQTRQHYGLQQMPITGAHCIGYYSQVLPNTGLSPLWTGCKAGLTALGIYSDGGVTGCLSLPEQYVEANVRTKSLEDIWNDPTFCLYNRQFTQDNLYGACKDCKHGKKCKGGCNAVSASMTGKLHADPFCLYHIENNYQLNDSQLNA